MPNEHDDNLLTDPEDCDECGCPAGEFEDSDCQNGVWHCPECGAPQ